MVSMVRLRDFLLVGTLSGLARAQIDPGKDLGRCVDQGVDLDQCTKRLFETIRPHMATGLKGAGLALPVPSVDPMFIEKIDFRFVSKIENSSVQFLDTDVLGLKKFQLLKSHIDKNKRKWELQLKLPRMELYGKYKMSGEYAGLDLGFSQGDFVFNATEVLISGEVALGNKNGKVDVQGMDLEVDFGRMAVAMDCLFPKSDGSCCPKKWKSSCSPIFSQTIHKAINKEADIFLDKFRPLVSSKFSEIMKIFISRGIQNLDAKYVINV